MTLGSLSLNTGSYFGSGYSYSGSTTNEATMATRISRDFARTHKANFQAIDSAIQSGNVKKAMKLYNNLLNALGSEYGEYDDMELANMLDEAYRTITRNDIVYQLEDETHCPFATGLLEGIPVIGLFVTGKSTAEATAKVTGQKATFGEKLGEWAGAVISNAGTYAAVGAAIGAPVGGIGAVPGAIAGGIIGAVVGTLKCIFK